MKLSKKKWELILSTLDHFLEDGNWDIRVSEEEAKILEKIEGFSVVLADHSYGDLTYLASKTGDIDLKIQLRYYKEMYKEASDRYWKLRTKVEDACEAF